MTTESRLDELRREAAERRIVSGAGVRPAGAPMPVASADTGYYGLPLLKPPVWTWEIPVYFFVGGAAGGAGLIGELARWKGDEAVERDARWIAAGGAAASAALLVSDLGRPERFLYMLRVFKPQSPMSVGVWIVVGFSQAAALALVASLGRRRWGGGAMRLIETTAGPAAAVTGLGMATYTGVLIGVTAVPVWARHARVLPVHFAFSGLAAAAALLQLLGHRRRSLRTLGRIAAAVETLVGARLELTTDRAMGPLKHGESGRLMRAAGVLSGPAPLALSLIGRQWPRLQRAAAVSALAGSLLTRLAWLQAGRASAADPAPALSLPAAAGSGSEPIVPDRASAPLAEPLTPAR